MSIQGVDESKTADAVFAEFYTSLMPELSLPRLESLVEKKFTLLFRHDLEEDEGRRILEVAERGKAVLLVPGDPLMATTHVDLRIRAEKHGIKTRLVHGASIVSAVVGLSGLQNYKFGRSVTVPFSDEGVLSETPYRVIQENKKYGLHTLCFLDIRAEEKRCMSIKEALEALLTIEKTRHRRLVTSSTVAVGIARAGSTAPIVKADRVERLMKFDFRGPPHSLVFLGRLHFMEAEALMTLAGAPKTIQRMIK